MLPLAGDAFHAVTARDRRGGLAAVDRLDALARTRRRAPAVTAMTNLTIANQLTLLRMLLIPAFVLLVVYAHLGWALVVLFVAGVTDALDGLIARRTGQKTTLGAWLDPMADKLLLTTPSSS